MNIVGTSRTDKLIVLHVMVPDTFEHLPAYHTHWQSQVQKMLDFETLKKNMLIYIALGFFNGPKTKEIGSHLVQLARDSGTKTGVFPLDAKLLCFRVIFRG